MARVFMKTPWLDGTDADYHSFDSLVDCCNYIIHEGIEEYVISHDHSELGEIPSKDYDYHRSDE